jgi:hypothetical protein
MMRIYRVAANALAVCAILFTGSAFAQVSADGMGKVIPVEMFVCDYKDRKDAGDYQKVTDRWTAFMDENGVDDYAAWMLTPYFYGGDQDFDFIWMGAYADGNAMGADYDTWLRDGGDINEAFGEVADCRAHIMHSSAMYKAPANNETPTSGIITMMNCKLNEGRRYADVKKAELKWAEYLTSNGSSAGFWHWFPAYGGGDSDFDYKVVFAYNNFTELGADFERAANGGGREAGEEIFADVDDCDDARIYLARSIRAAQLR